MLFHNSMKKEALVLVLFVTLYFVLGARCEKQDEDIGFSDDQALIDWSESFPDYSSSEDIENQFQDQINLALETGNIEECEKIIISSEEESGESFQKKVNALHQCSTLLTKKKAFLQKDYIICNDLYAEGGDNKDFEECKAPISAYIAIVNQNNGICKERINDRRLLALCEDDYEKFS